MWNLLPGVSHRGVGGRRSTTMSKDSRGGLYGVVGTVPLGPWKWPSSKGPSRRVSRGS